MVFFQIGVYFVLLTYINNIVASAYTHTHECATPFRSFLDRHSTLTTPSEIRRWLRYMVNETNPDAEVLRPVRDLLTKPFDTRPYFEETLKCTLADPDFTRILCLWGRYTPEHNVEDFFEDYVNLGALMQRFGEEAGNNFTFTQIYIDSMREVKEEHTPGWWSLVKTKSINAGLDQMSKTHKSPKYDFINDILSNGVLNVNIFEAILKDKRESNAKAGTALLTFSPILGKDDQIWVMHTTAWYKLYHMWNLLFCMDKTWGGFAPHIPLKLLVPSLHCRVGSPQYFQYRMPLLQQYMKLATHTERPLEVEMQVASKTQVSYFNEEILSTWGQWNLEYTQAHKNEL